MFHYDDLGAGLGLLSLDDIRGCHASSTLQRHILPHDTNNGFSDDDGMDIDSVSLASHQDLTEIDAEIQENNDGDCADEDSANTLLANILSPTTLGVHYALKHRLLLPPPESIKTESPVDYEFDTSRAHLHSTGVVNQPNRSKFDPIPPYSIFNAAGSTNQSNEVEDQLSVLVEEPEMYENSMNRSFRYRSQISPAPYSIVHHHHYYGAQTGFQNGHPGFQNGYQGFQDSGNSQLGPGLRPDLQPAYGQNGLTDEGKIDGSSDLNTSSNLNSSTRDPLHTALTRRHSLQSKDVVLPSPWDSHLMPAEKAPYLFSLYLQLVINLSLSVYTGHLLVSIVRTIKQDVAYKLEKEANNLLVEIALCERSYYENNCQPESIVPALEKMCAHWEKCMNQDPFRGGNKSLVSAHTIAMIVNLLIEPLSFKVLFVFASALLLVFVSNFAFGYIRAKTYYGWSHGHGLQA